MNFTMITWVVDGREDMVVGSGGGGEGANTNVDRPTSDLCHLALTWPPRGVINTSSRDRCSDEA